MTFYTTFMAVNSGSPQVELNVMEYGLSSSPAFSNIFLSGVGLFPALYICSDAF